MTAVCPTCGQPILRRPSAAIERLVARLKERVPHEKWPRGRKNSIPTNPGRHIYPDKDGRYWITYSSDGPLDPLAVKQAIADGILVPECPGLSVDCWKLA